MLTIDDRAFLKSQQVARLATVDRAGSAALVPVCFALLGERIYIPIDAKPKSGDPRNLKRLRNLRERPEAVLLLDHFEEDWSRLRWLSVRASAEVLDQGAERTTALARLEERYPQYAAMRLAGLGLPVIALQPTAVQRWSAS